MLKNKTKIGLFILVLLISLVFLSCKQFMKTKEYNYGVGASCAAGYTIDLNTGIFKSPEGDIIPILDHHLTGVWGQSGCDKSGDGFDPLPNRLRLGFYSETEDKFYEGEFNLPYEQLQQLFEEEDDNPFYKGKVDDDEQSGRKLKYMNYDSIEIAITVGGYVSVWVNGINSRKRKEIAHFKVKEAPETKWEDIYPDGGTREANVAYSMEKIYTPRIKSQILTNTLPYELWNCYRKKYNWRYVFEFPDGGKLDEFYLNYLNSEADNIFADNPKLNNDTYQMRALPYNLDLEMHNGKGEKYGAWIVSTESVKYLKKIYKSGEGDKYPDDYREEELYQIFQTLDPNKPIDIIYKITPDYENIKIFIKQGDKELPYTKVTQWLMKSTR